MDNTYGRYNLRIGYGRVILEDYDKEVLEQHFKNMKLLVNDIPKARRRYRQHDSCMEF